MGGSCCTPFFVAQGARLISHTASPLIQLTSSTFDNRDPVRSGGDIFGVQDTFNAAPAGELVAAARVELAGGLLRSTNSTVEALFNAVNAARESGGTVLAAGNAPPAQLPLREDLKSRLAWGLVYQVKPLSDAEKALTLHAEAQRRGLKLSDEVVWYLLTHVQRDLRTLTALLEHIDRASL